ncbi:MAG: YigZ family protein [Flavobacteriaceae bacterium]|nr:YigZ family protein [Flavobacteriaceae bacterium]
MTEKDTYRTIAKPTDEVIYKDRSSKFFGYVYPITTEEEVKEIVETLKLQHHKARHWCYAWQLGVENIRFRANDDGEPNNSAGQPIYGQILSKELTNILVVVVRYFGGIKLGVGGLVTAYKTAAQMAIENAIIIEKLVEVQFKLSFDYQYMNVAMRAIKENDIAIINQTSALHCELIISTRKKNTEKVKEIISSQCNAEV